MRMDRVPRPALRPFVSRLWLSDYEPGVNARREHVLPTGAMHVVIRLGDEPLRLLEAGIARAIGTCVIGGPRGGFYIKDISNPVRTVGAMLRPGAALPLFGAPASAFADAHTSLDDVWTVAARELRDELRALVSPVAVLDRFETALAARLPRVRGVHPAIAHALARFNEHASVADVVDEIGYSHRRFLTMFRDQVGLGPKRYCRVRRFQHALAATAAGEPFPAIAHASGYADQAHFTREFHELAGVSPTEYRRLQPVDDNHVQIPSPS